MANIGLNTIFPSAKFISTDAKGDVNEVTAQSATDASASIQGIDIASVASESLGNGITFEITESNASDGISASGNTITLALKHEATDYRLNEYSIDTSASASHLAISVGEFIYFTEDDDLSWRNESSNTSELLNFFKGNSFEVIGKDSSSRPIVTIAGTNYIVLAGEYKASWGKRIDSVSSILSGAGSDVTDLVSISISGSDSDNLTGTGSVQTDGGLEAIPSDLVASSKYLLIETSDIFDLEGTEEEADGRKVFYGLLETATANMASNPNKSESLIINRGSLILVSDGKLRRSYNITANLDILDSDLSDES